MSFIPKKKKPRKSKVVKSKKRPKKLIPIGRTLSTYDKYLPGAETGSKKERGVVVLDRNKRGDLAVVPLSKHDGKHRTKLPNYQDGKTRFKHFVETEDNEGSPIRVNSKFRANHQNQDISAVDMNKIRDKVLYHSKPALGNRKKLDDFHANKKSPRD